MNITKIRPEEETLFWLKPYLPPFTDDWYKRNHLNSPLKKDSDESS
jgi:hypothetical protein